MSAIAWYYNVGDGIYYWADSWSMSATEFANKVSSEIGKNLTAADISAPTKLSDVEAMKRRAISLYKL